MLPQSAVREGVSEVNSRDSMPPLYMQKMNGTFVPRNVFTVGGKGGCFKDEQAYGRTFFVCRESKPISN
jgi:hypothetical protein